MATNSSLEANELAATPINRTILIAASVFVANKASSPALFKLHYDGDQEDYSYEVNADGDLILRHGPEGARVADTTFNTTGTADVSVTATIPNLAALLALINASPNWSAIAKDGLPSFLVDNVLLSTGGEVVKGDLGTDDGAHVLLDIDGCNDLITGETDHVIPICVSKEAENVHDEPFDSVRSDGAGDKSIYTFENQLIDYVRKQTVGSGTAATDGWRLVVVNDKTGTERDILPENDGAATTVEFSMKDKFTGPFRTRYGERLVLLQHALAKPSLGYYIASGKAIRRGLVFRPLD